MMTVGMDLMRETVQPIHQAPCVTIMNLSAALAINAFQNLFTVMGRSTVKMEVMSLDASQSR